MRKILLTVGALLALVAMSVLIPGSPTRAFASGVANVECVTWFGHDEGSTLVAYGDSITQGDSQPQYGLQGEESWYSHLVCPGEYAHGSNGGVQGETSAQVLARLEDEAPPADVLVVSAGTNDLRDGVPTEVTIGNLRAAVQLADDLADVVVLTTVQPWTDTDATALNEAIEQLADEAGVQLADFAAALADPEATSDGVHPTPQASRELARLVATAAQAA